MGGERYRICRVNSNHVITPDEINTYRLLLPTLIQKVENWLQTQDPNAWTLELGHSEALLLKVKYPTRFRNEILFPKEFDHSFKLGWQDFRYGTDIDPKKEIVDQLINFVRRTSLISALQIEEEDNVAIDLGYGDFWRDESEEVHQSKGPCHYLAGISDSEWSPTGLYGGYDSWATYRAANGLEPESWNDD